MEPSLASLGPLKTSKEADWHDLDFAQVMEEVGAKAAASEMISVKIAEANSMANSDGVSYASGVVGGKEHDSVIAPRLQLTVVLI